MGCGKVSNAKRAEELLEILNAGEYQLGNRLISIPNFDKATYYKYSQLKALEEVEEMRLEIPKQSITIINKSTVDVAIHEGAKRNDVGVLNFASAMNPGGGFIKGSMAQEEALCQASTLYLQLKDSEMYTDNRNECKDGYYNDSMNVCKSIFIRDGRDNLLAKPIEVTVVTSAAVNVRRLNTGVTKAVETVMRQRMEEIIRMFIRNSCKVIILGAFGCGVFLNDPRMIAEIWYELLEKYGGHFDKVVFAILSRHGDTNIDIFNEVFKQ